MILNWKIVIIGWTALLTGVTGYIMADMFIPASTPLKTTIVEATTDHVTYRNEFVRNKRCKSQIDRFISINPDDPRTKRFIYRDSVPGFPEMQAQANMNTISGLHLIPDTDYELHIFVTLFCTFITDPRAYPPVRFRVSALHDPAVAKDGRVP